MPRRRFSGASILFTVTVCCVRGRTQGGMQAKGQRKGAIIVNLKSFHHSPWHFYNSMKIIYLKYDQATILSFGAPVKNVYLPQVSDRTSPIEIAAPYGYSKTGSAARTAKPCFAGIFVFNR